MELGEKLRQARLEAGLSQRQLCGGEITRNMLSQIENGSASPSMGTLRYLAARLGKSISFFLEEEAVTSPNQERMAWAREAYREGRYEDVLAVLTDWKGPDPVFDAERQLLEGLSLLALAENALGEGRTLYAGELLDRAEDLGLYETPELDRRRLLLLIKARPGACGAICGKLPGLDEELMYRAGAALAAGNTSRAAALLDAAEDRENPDWNFLRGEANLAARDYAAAAACYHRAETAYPEKTAPRLEQCYRELEDFKQAYFYACRQK